TLHLLHALLLQRAPSAADRMEQLSVAGSVEEVWAVAGGDSWATIPCHSTASPGTLLNGTRITLSRTNVEVQCIYANSHFTMGHYAPSAPPST
ncbi:unnamed protein product, partial [Closterium sp. Naga37s-1]